MLSLKTGGSPAVEPRIGLLTAAYVFLFDGCQSGDECGRTHRSPVFKGKYSQIYIRAILIATTVAWLQVEQSGTS